MKKNLKSLSALLLALALLFTSVSMSLFTSGCTNATDNDENPTDAPSISCTLAIDATTAYDNPDLDSAIRDVLANSGLIMDSASISTAEGSTVTDVLRLGTRLNNISVNIQDGDYGAFILGIGGLENGACGDMSYWLLKINGEFPSTGADSITLNDGDEIVWVYTCNGGEDVGYIYEG